MFRVGGGGSDRSLRLVCNGRQLVHVDFDAGLESQIGIERVKTEGDVSHCHVDALEDHAHEQGSPHPQKVLQTGPERRRPRRVGFHLIRRRSSHGVGEEGPFESCAGLELGGAGPGGPGVDGPRVPFTFVSLLAVDDETVETEFDGCAVELRPGDADLDEVDAAAGETDGETERVAEVRTERDFPEGERREGTLERIGVNVDIFT